MASGVKVPLPEWAVGCVVDQAAAVLDYDGAKIGSHLAAALGMASKDGRGNAFSRAATWISRLYASLQIEELCKGGMSKALAYEEVPG